MMIKKMKMKIGMKKTIKRRNLIFLKNPKKMTKMILKRMMM